MRANYQVLRTNIFSLFCDLNGISDNVFIYMNQMIKLEYQPNHTMLSLSKLIPNKFALSENQSIFAINKIGAK